MAVPMRASRWSGTPTWSVRTAGPTSRAHALDRRPSRVNWRWHHLPLSMHDRPRLPGRAWPSARARDPADIPRSGGPWRGSTQHPWRRAGPAGGACTIPSSRQPCRGCLDSDRPDAVIRAQAVEARSRASRPRRPATARPRRQEPSCCTAPSKAMPLLSAIDLFAAGSDDREPNPPIPQTCPPALPVTCQVAIDLQGLRRGRPR